MVHSLSHRCLFLLLWFPARVHAFRTGLPHGLRKDHFSSLHRIFLHPDVKCRSFSVTFYVQSFVFALDSLDVALRFAHQSEMQRASEMIQALLKTSAATQRTPYHPLPFFVAASSEGGSGARLSLSRVVC